MKKLFLYVFLVLMLSNNANSMVFKKCYTIYDSRSDIKHTAFNTYHYSEHYYEIDLNRKIFTQVQVSSDRKFKEAKKSDEEFDKTFPQWADDYTPIKVNTLLFQITLANEDLIVGEATDDFKMGFVKYDFYHKITIDIKKEQVTLYTESYQKLLDDDAKKDNYHTIYQCEGDFSDVSTDQKKYWWVVVLIVLISFFIYTQTVKTTRRKKNRKS